MTLSSAQSWITAPLRMLSGNYSRRDDALTVRPGRPIDPLKLLRRSMRSKLGTHLRKTESHENRLNSNRGHAHEGGRLAARLRGQSRPHSNCAGWTSLCRGSLERPPLAEQVLLQTTNVQFTTGRKNGRGSHSRLHASRPQSSEGRTFGQAEFSRRRPRLSSAPGPPQGPEVDAVGCSRESER